MRRFFIMASERSGSNLLRSMLGMHPELSAPPPPHALRHLAAVAPSYGSLERREALRAAVADAVSLTRVERSHVRWRYDVREDRILESVAEPTVVGVVAALYDEYARLDGTSGWISKEGAVFDHAFRIRDTLPDARFLYLVRDGRDVTCSMLRVPTHDQHPYFVAREWVEQQESCIGVYQALAPRGAAHLVRYEELIEDPRRELGRICEFLGLDFRPVMLDFHRDEATRQQAGRTEYWKNLARPVLSANKWKFLRDLSEAELAIVEGVAGPTLRLLGYPLVSDRPRTPGPVRRMLYAAVNWLRVRRQRRRLLEEPGRAERHAALRRIYEGARAREPEPFAPSIEIPAGDG